MAFETHGKYLYGWLLKRELSAWVPLPFVCHGLHGGGLASSQAGNGLYMRLLHTMGLLI